MEIQRLGLVMKIEGNSKKVSGKFLKLIYPEISRISRSLWSEIKTKLLSESFDILYFDELINSSLLDIPCAQRCTYPENKL